MTVRRPLFSIITPVFNPPLEAFNECIASVLRQSFEDWEWCIVDDAADQSRLGGILEDLAKRDARIRVSLRGVNGGIVSASNDAASMARGQFLCLLDHDDMLHPTALEEVAAAVKADEIVDYVYTDEDKIDAAGNHYDVFLKPDWSPERLRGQNYCCHLSVIRRDLFESIGGFRPGFDGSQDYDLILRVTEKARHIRHIPKVLYHWRAIEGSTAASQSEKPYAFNAAHRAVQDHLERVGMNAFVADAGFGYHRVVRRLSAIPLVSIVIPTRGDSKLIRGSARSLVLRCVDSILANRHHYANLEIVVVADTSTPGPVLSELGSRAATKVIAYDKPFNFSDKCNVGFLNSSGEIIILLNDDTEVITGDWLVTLVALMTEPDVGIVGPMLLLEDGRIQSAGHSNTPSPHNFRFGHSANQPGEFGILAISRECSGVTGAAMTIRRDVYSRVGGMSLKFANCFNDVDFNCKVLELGLRIIWTPFAKLFHYESVSRDATVSDDEYELLLRRWYRYFDNDVFTRLN
jgi:glycosyltransferase involved in cell wall biosynthesis